MKGRKTVFLDLEVSPETGSVLDYGAVMEDGNQVRTSSAAVFAAFIQQADFLCGHHLIRHDLPHIAEMVRERCPEARMIDTLPLSPLLFPTRPYHHLLKDDKLQSDELNNPLNDAKKAMELFQDEISAFSRLPGNLKEIYIGLLRENELFSGFFAWMGIGLAPSAAETEGAICRTFDGQICAHADLAMMIRNTPAELAYALALIHVDDPYSITPPWVVRSFPRIQNLMKLLRGTPCGQACAYCGKKLNVHVRLKEFFGFPSFRTYEGDPLQERAVEAAVRGESLLAVFPTGGGKSLTFQLPALMAGETDRGLTVVISPLQSLMKDQVDHLEERGIADAVTINGMLNPLERKAAINRVANGLASILYISPESLRSRTVETLLLSRNVIRFVIDEAHCFSAWGQDFRVDYMYIGDFIRKLQEMKQLEHGIPVSCFTATAKQKVISDIREYFREKLGLELALFTTNAARRNLRYAVLYKEDDESKYQELRNLIQARNCPAIVYVSRVRRTREIASRLREDGFAAEPYNGQMAAEEKIRIQEAFLQDQVQVIVATSAFGMGVDKKDVGLVVHFDISDSLENYVQEAGRAGRDDHLEADCYVLFNDDDLDKHFILLNQTKLSISEIQQVWRAIKEMTRRRMTIHCSALEIARQAGWEETGPQMETRVTSAIAALESAGYLERGRNTPHIYANSIQAPDMATAAERLDQSVRMTADQRETAKRIIKYLISRKNTHAALAEEAESRVDYLADRLGLTRENVVDSVLMMREEGLMADQMDLSARIRGTEPLNRTEQILRRMLDLESFLLDRLADDPPVNYRELNDEAIRSGIKSATIRRMKTLVFFWIISGDYRKSYLQEEERVILERVETPERQRMKFERRHTLSEFIVEYLYRKVSWENPAKPDETTVWFSVRELQEAFNHPDDLRMEPFEATMENIQHALLYLSKIGALSLEGGFLVSYNAMQLHRLKQDNRIQYKNEDYKLLNEYYQQRIQQIHIVGEYAHMMVRNYEEALQFVSDYFRMNYRAFLNKYFKGTRQGEINRNITPEKYQQLFGGLSETQRKIIEDDQTRALVVSAGPGSGKTRLLVHKLASLMLMEDVKHEQMLMLTFSRAAATEFKSRLIGLIGNAAHFVEIRTFHSYCFDLLGQMGTLEDAPNAVRQAVEMIRNGEVEPGRITKSVLVIDEAQDMDEDAFALVRALMEKNEGMRVIAVGDDDQNIYGFRGSDSRHMMALTQMERSRLYQMTENYRSDRAIVRMANAWARTIRDRAKTREITAVRDREGSVVLRQYVSRNLETPVARFLAERAAQGTRCVLTATNEEAARVTGLLLSAGVPARLIQSNEDFDLNALAEIRFFLRETEGDSTLIDDAAWDAAVEKMKSAYADSTALPVCLAMLNRFAGVNRRKYRNDLKEFLRESHLEDFFTEGGGKVIVSTIHKAKGREFDHVDLMLDRTDLSTEEAKRKIYVGMTRARESLTIHTNLKVFERLEVSGITRVRDNTAYEEPRELMMQLGHRDVYLDFFKGMEKWVTETRAGQELTLDGRRLLSREGRKPLACLSKACEEKVKGLEEKGYRFDQAQIRHVAAWTDRKDQRETWIILPDLYFRREETEKTPLDKTSKK